MTSTQASEITGTPVAARREFMRFLDPRRISALYVLAALIIMFAIWVPSTFLTSTTLRDLLNEQAITAIMAVGLVVPLAAGGFDLSVGFSLGLGVAASAWLAGQHGLPAGLTLLIAVAFGVAVGAINGLLVARVRIQSFVATLAVGSCLSAVIGWVTNNETVLVPTGFQSIATREIIGIQLPVFMLLVIAVVTWFVLDYTVLGRRIYAIGGNPEAARLSGLPIAPIIFGAFVVSGTLAAFAGALLCAQSAAGSPTVGPEYLLPAFAAVFLGATQFQTSGRFNVWGTVVAVYVLATGVKGLQLAGAPFWIPALFNGLALLIAVAVSGMRGKNLLRRRLRPRSEVQDSPPDHNVHRLGSDPSPHDQGATPARPAATDPTIQNPNARGTQ